MARTLLDAKLDSRASRQRLKLRREPYWRTISEGLAIGYRKGSKGGTWIARHYTSEHGRRFYSIGTADDVADADGTHILSFAQAQEAGRKWFSDLARRDDGEISSEGYTVANAMADYVTAYKRRGGKALYRMQSNINAHINPTLGDKLLTKLTRRQMEAWLDGIAATDPRKRTKQGAEQQYRTITEANEEALRRRRNSANRVLNILKAALNLAHQNRRALNRDAWEAVKPYREVDSPKIRYLSDDEARRLMNACADDMRMIATGALLSGARYGELAALTVANFNTDSGTLHIQRSKSGKPRYIVLTDEGRTFFADMVTGKKGDTLIFLRASGAKWKHADQYRPIQDACKAANIFPAIGFHILRHTYGSRLAMQGVPMAVIAAQLGHADTRMTEKHYAHLAPSYVAETVRAAFTDMGLNKENKIQTLALKTAKIRR